MATVQEQVSWAEEIADFFLSRPTHDQILDHRPSKQVQDYLSQLLHKNREGELTEDEREELDEAVVLENFMQLVKAKLRLLPKFGDGHAAAVNTV